MFIVLCFVDHRFSVFFLPQYTSVLLRFTNSDYPPLISSNFSFLIISISRDLLVKPKNDVTFLYVGGGCVENAIHVIVYHVNLLKSADIKRYKTENIHTKAD